MAASTKRSKAKPKGGLTKWFKEEWVDLKTGKPCGRSGKEKSSRAYPSCRPKKVAAKMTAAEKKSRVAQKKRLGQPAGKPKRVKPLKRKKK